MFSAAHGALVPDDCPLTEGSASKQLSDLCAMSRRVCWCFCLTLSCVAAAVNKTAHVFGAGLISAGQKPVLQEALGLSRVR